MFVYKFKKLLIFSLFDDKLINYNLIKTLESAFLYSEK